MPVKIPVYQQQTEIQNAAPAPDAPMAVPTNNVGSAIEGLGQAGSQFAGVQQMVARDAAATDTARVTSQVGLQLNQLKNDTVSNAPTGGYGLTDGFMQKFNDLRSSTLDGVTDPYAKRFLNSYFDHQAEVYGSTMQNQETSMKANYIATNIGTAGDNVARTVSQDPTQYNAALAPVLGSISALSGIDGNMKLALTKKLTEQAAYAAGLRTATDNPQAYLSAAQLPPGQAKPAGFDWMASLDPEKANMLENHAKILATRQQNALATQQLAAQNASTDIQNQAFDLVDKGQVPSLDMQQDMLNKARLVGPQEVAAAQALIDQGNQHAGFGSMNFAQRQAELAREQAAASTPGQGVNATTSKVIAARQKINDGIMSAAKENPWAAAQTYGVTQNAPIMPINTPQDALQVIQSRAGAQGAVEAWTGGKVSPLQPEEAQATLQALNTLSPEAKAQELQQMGTAIGDPQRIGALAAQWKQSSPAMSLAMKLGAAGPDGRPLMTANGVPVSTFVLAGAQAKKDGTVKVDETADAGIKSQIARTIDGTLPPEQAQDAKDTAYWMAIGQAARNGRTQIGNSDIQDSINTATGGISTTGGTPLSGNVKNYSVARPFGWTDDQFQGAVKTAGVANIENQANGQPIDTVVANGHEIPAADFMSKFSSYRLQRVGIKGTYAVSTGSKFVTDKTGAPVTVQLQMPSK